MSDIDLNDRTPLIVDGGTRHVIIDADGLVTNVILWDGTNPYDPGDNLTLHPLPDDSPIGPGDTVTIDKGDVVVLAKATPLPAVKSIEERLDAIEVKTDKLPDVEAADIKAK